MSENNKRGIDISERQGRIDFSSVKAFGVDFIMIRCGAGGDREIQDDPYFERNVAECERYGIPWGGYLYSYATDFSQAEEEYRHILRLMKGKKPTYPICINMEDIDGYRRKHDVSDRMTATLCAEICNRLEEAGYYVGVHSTLYWLTHSLNDPKLDRFDKWLIQWGTVPTYPKPFGIWQNSTGCRIPGISCAVETDSAYRDYPAIIKSAGLNGW